MKLLVSDQILKRVFVFDPQCREDEEWLKKCSLRIIGTLNSYALNVSIVARDPSSRHLWVTDSNERPNFLWGWNRLGPQPIQAPKTQTPPFPATHG